MDYERDHFFHIMPKTPKTLGMSLLLLT